MPPFAIDLIWIVAAILIVGVLLWGLEQIPSIDPAFKTFAKIVLIVVGSIWVIYYIANLATGLLGHR